MNKYDEDMLVVSAPIVPQIEAQCNIDFLKTYPASLLLPYVQGRNHRAKRKGSRVLALNHALSLRLLAQTCFDFLSCGCLARGVPPRRHQVRTLAHLTATVYARGEHGGHDLVGSHVI